MRNESKLGDLQHEYDKVGIFLLPSFYQKLLKGGGWISETYCMVGSIGK